MKTKILATIYTILVFVIMIFIGYVFYFFPEKVIWIILPISGSVLFMSIWIGIYKLLKK